MPDTRNKKQNARKLSRTSRITPNINEYLSEIAVDRELERFMVFSSGSSSVGAHSQQSQHSASAQQQHPYCAMASGGGSGKSASSSEELPTTAVVVAAAKAKPCAVVPSAKTKPCAVVQSADVSVIIPICRKPISPVQPRQERLQCTHSLSVEDLRTPTKTQHSKKTQTPESALKSHKRLEWDSAADVGYKRAASTSNISTLERSVLEDQLLKGASLPQPCIDSSRANQSESDLNRLQAEQGQSTPPLASSTFVNRTLSKTRRLQPKQLQLEQDKRNQGTNTTLHKYHNQSAQTSVQRAHRQIQTSSRTLSRYSSSAASSFDYHNSRPSTACTPCSSTSTNLSEQTPSADELLRRLEEQQQEQQYKAQLEEVLRRRRRLLAPVVSNENKENEQPDEAGSETTKRDLDLGIELLCSLVHSRSLNNSQKKQLIRDIAMRISCLDSISSSRHSSNHNLNLRSRKKSQSSTASDKGLPKSSKNGSRNSTQSSHSFSKQIFTAKELQNNDKENEVAAPVPIRTTDTNNALASTAAVLSCDSADKRSNQNSLTTAKTSDTQSKDQLTMSKTKETAKSSNSSQSTSPTSTNSKELITQKTNVKPKSNDSAAGSQTDAELVAMQEWLNPMTQSEIEYEEKRAQQGAAQRNSGNAELRNQIDYIETEIERLQRLRNLLFGAAEQAGVHIESDTLLNVPSAELGNAETGLHTATRSFDPAKKQMVHIESDILLVGPNSEFRHAEPVVQQIYIEQLPPVEAGQSNMAADQVPALPVRQRTSVVLPRSQDARRKQPPTDGNEQNITIEQAPPALPVPRRRRLAPPAPPVTPATSPVLPTLQAPPPPPSPPPRARVLPATTRQRDKMATPASSSGDHSSGNGSESVCSFVQQRQREFMQHYQNMQQTQQNALQQQRRERLVQQQQLHEQLSCFQLQQQQQTQRQMVHQNSQPHLHYQPCLHQQQAQCQVQQCLQYAQRDNVYTMPHTYSCIDDTAVYYQVLDSRGGASCVQATGAEVTTKRTTVAATTAATSTGSSSSMLCISSEISIPMVNTSETTTTTTTHHYDDVACATRHICGSQRRRHYCYQQHMQSQPLPQQRHTHSSASYAAVASVVPTMNEATNGWSSHQAGMPHLKSFNAVQVHPRGIAYMIQFDKHTKGEIVAETLSLQEYLQLARPEFCAKSKERKAILNQMQLLRNARRREMEKLIENTSLEGLDKRLMELPPPAVARMRIFSTKEMKALTKKRCESLPEVLADQRKQREEQSRRSNRILRDVFNKRLQRRVRNGKLSLNHSRTVI